MDAIYLLTYDQPHRKTQDLVFRLGVEGIRPTLIVLPWEERENFIPLYETKLKAIKDVWPGALGLHLANIKDVPPGAVVLVGGAPILPADFVNARIVINAHCGWLPKRRGLDALKWAIYHNARIGVTVHQVDEDCDRGFLIQREEIPTYPMDSLFSIAVRQYEREIDMLVEVAVHKDWLLGLPFEEPAGTVTRRMPHATEIVMMKRLEYRLSM